MVGGWEVGHPIFVSAVEPNSIPDRAGVRVGDQVSVSFPHTLWELFITIAHILLCVQVNDGFEFLLLDVAQKSILACR